MVTMREFTCAICGRKFSKISLRMAKYCSEQCRNQAALLSKKRRRERQEVRDSENKSQREYRQRYATRTCKICGREFIPKMPRQRCCSPECSAKNRHGHVQNPLLDKACVVCGKHFESYQPRAKYCSRRCANQANSGVKKFSADAMNDYLTRFDPQPRKCPGLPWARCRNLLPPSWPRYRCADCDRKWRERYNLHAYDDAALNDD